MSANRGPGSVFVLSLPWPAALLAGALGLALSIAVPALTVAVNRLLPPYPGGTVESVASSGSAWLLLVGVLTASVIEELLCRAYLIERLMRLTGSPWLGTLLSLAAFVAFHLMAHVLMIVEVFSPGVAGCVSPNYWDMGPLVDTCS